MNRKRIGSILIGLSLILLLYIYYPIIQLYLFPPTISATQAATGSFIQIPKIGASAQIIENVDPWKKEQYNQALEKGVAHAQGTNFYFAHSSLPPWKMTRTNTAFLRLAELKNGDQINIIRDGQLKSFMVFDKKEVWPSETQYLQATSQDQIILQSCVPVGTDLRRLLIFARLQN